MPEAGADQKSRTKEGKVGKKGGPKKGKAKAAPAPEPEPEGGDTDAGERTRDTDI